MSKASIVPDYRFTASSWYQSGQYAPYKARLNGESGWAPEKWDRKTCSLNIDLGKVYILCAVETQGFNSKRKPEWTKTYSLNMSIDNFHWEEYTEKGEKKVSVNKTGKLWPLLKTLFSARLISILWHQSMQYRKQWMIIFTFCWEFHSQLIKSLRVLYNKLINITSLVCWSASFKLLDFWKYELWFLLEEQTRLNAFFRLHVASDQPDSIYWFYHC